VDDRGASGGERKAEAGCCCCWRRRRRRSKGRDARRRRMLLLLLALADANDILRLDAWLVGRRNAEEWSDRTRRTGLIWGCGVEGELGLNRSIVFEQGKYYGYHGVCVSVQCVSKPALDRERDGG